MVLQVFLQKALREGWAMPHFNISNFVQLKGIVKGAQELSAPVMIGTSESEAKFIGLTSARYMIDALKSETGLPLFLNADHFHSVKMCKAAIDAGYDAVLIDLSKKPYGENVADTKKVVDYARSKNADISVEGELGYIVTDSSKIYKKAFRIPAESLTEPKEARTYVAETGVDRFAAAVGSLHGIAANKPVLDFGRIEELRREMSGDTALVLHGGSGLAHEDFTNAISLGMNNIHISTTLRIAYVEALKRELKDRPEETTPYKLYSSVVDAVADKVREFIVLFGAEKKAVL